MPVRILVPLFHHTHLLFLGSAFLNDVTLRCNPYIMCITRSTGCFGIMHTVIWFYPINKQFVFWCGIVHWFRTIFCLCWHEITISNTSLLTGTSPATLNLILICVMALGKVWPRMSVLSCTVLVLPGFLDIQL